MADQGTKKTSATHWDMSHDPQLDPQLDQLSESMEEKEQREEEKMILPEEPPADLESDVADKAWLKYWQLHGETLLWGSWVEKHPEFSSEVPLVPWECSEWKEAWEEHASQGYTYYWEQFHYWAAQGWTTDESSAAAAVCDDGQHGPHGKNEVEKNEPSSNCDHGSGISQSSLEVNSCEITECFGGLNLLTNEGDGNDSHQAVESNCADEPCDGGNRKRSSSGTVCTDGEYLS